MSRVFISYSREDREFVDGLARQLESSGHDVWLDRKEISGGKNWLAEIGQAIPECSFFLLVISPSSAASKRVMQELALADESGCTIIPIRHQECDDPPQMKLQLGNIQRIDFVMDPQAALESLLEAMQQDGRAAGRSAAGAPVKGRDNPAAPSAPSWAATAPPSPFAAPAPPVLALAQVLVGAWQVQIFHPLGGVGSVALAIDPAGMFRGQVMKPTGVTSIEGQWQITPLNQVVLQGQETNGFMFLPYTCVIQFQQVTPGRLSGVSGAGEQVIWQRVT